jgi:hypothetical protein
VVAAFSCDLHYCLRYAKDKLDSILAKELESIDLAQVQKNTVLVSMRGAVHKDWHNKGIFKKFTYERSVHLVKNGYIKTLGLVNNPYSLKVLIKAGSKILNEFIVEEKGHKIHGYFI